ncbi:Sulfur transfer protein involved in thiamine biosynthesis [Archaeoglobus sulfaticallidus PM70-1]|uniref:Sulfur transfer protein involved in thiamine biosynthesis n=1 Tax=Archaeoglobus sulfaticallidus PM70-1 TaxID=387631 RepID=N0BDU3_9EURY|nr:ubiquitin-like small modifier protein 2 [Archaeoglobus sulfaticallidus]AGK61799.1 Sulfur transfer protein involved in thiamine biosynthesis [Archaeoglobus sulfaticallidus PM70-1]
MKVKVKVSLVGFEPKEKELILEENSTYLDILNIFSINPESVLILKDGSPVPLDDVVEEGEIKIMKVISGG